MDKKESLDKLEEICSKEENIRKILQAKTKDDIKPLFEESGIELTDEKFDILKKVYIGIVEKLRNMSEKELESISGGRWENAKIGTGYGLVIGAPIGAVMGAVNALDDIVRDERGWRGEIGFWEKLKRIVKKTTIGTLCGAAAGSVVAGLPSAGRDLISEGIKRES